MSTSNDTADLLARVARTKTVRLIARGRRSGKPREVTIWFVVVDGAIGLGTLNDDRNWVRNARAAGEVELVFADARLRGRFADVADPERHRRIRAAMARKYLPFRIASWFGLGQKVTFAVDGLERSTG
jgi:deazaflavin-dependent oxidoreductase (nitroreductase family)